MNTSCLTGLTLLLVACAAIATIPVYAGESEPPPRSWMVSVREATIALGVIRDAKVAPAAGSQTTTKIFAVVGTGVLFGAPGQNDGAPWLVTAKHVFLDPAQGWDPETIQIRFAWYEARSVDEYLGVTLKLKDAGRRLWVPHPDPEVDLAAIPLVVSKSDAGRDSIAPISLSSFPVAADIFEGASVFVFGYPGAVGPKFWTKAVLRSGVVAWLDPVDSLNRPFLVDAMVFPGNSGGPVFKAPIGVDQFGNIILGGKLAFLGIVSQGRKETSPLIAGEKPVELQGPTGTVKVVSQEWIGVGVVEPASRVLKLLESAQATAKAGNHP